MKAILLLVLTFAACSSNLVCGEIPRVSVSPDRSLRAEVLSVGKSSDDSFDVVRIWRGGKQIAERRLTRNSKGMARGIYDSKWSPDSRFFVFLTKYIGGHSIWHSPTSVFDAKTNRLVELDDHLGPVVSNAVSFVGPDVLRIEVANPKTGAASPAVVKSISLSRWMEEVAKNKNTVRK